MMDEKLLPKERESETPQQLVTRWLFDLTMKLNVKYSCYYTKRAFFETVINDIRTFEVAEGDAAEPFFNLEDYSLDPVPIDNDASNSVSRSITITPDSIIYEFEISIGNHSWR